MSWLKSLFHRLVPPVVVPPDPEVATDVDGSGSTEHRHSEHQHNGALADLWQRTLEARVTELEMEAAEVDLVTEADMLAAQMADEKQRDLLLKYLSDRQRKNPH